MSDQAAKNEGRLAKWRRLLGLQTQRPVSAPLATWSPMPERPPRVVQICTTHTRGENERDGQEILTALVSDGRIFKTESCGRAWYEVTGPKL